MILQLDLEISLGQGSGYELVGQSRLTQVNESIKVTIIIILKPDSGSIEVRLRLGGQHGLTQVNVWIKMVIIMVLKPDSRVDLRHGLGH